MCIPSLRKLFFLFSFCLFFSLTSIQIAAALPGDIDDSGKVDGFDLITFARAFNSSNADANWDSNADLNGDGQINQLDLAILRDNFGKTGVSQNCWVADENNQSVARLAGKTGQEVFRSASGVTGYTRSIWGNPADSSAWISDNTNNRIIKISSSGEILTTINGFNGPEGLSVDTVRGVIWVADKTGSRVVRIKTDAADGYDISTDTGSHAVISGASQPVSVSVNTTDGSCWVTDTRNYRIIKLQADTPDGYDLASDSGYHLFVTGFSTPSGVSVDNITGSCWVADTYNHQIVKLSATGSEEFRLSGFSYPVGVSVNPVTGNCWVADKSNGQIVKLSADGGILARISGFNNPLSVSVDVVRGDCWVGDYLNNQIVKLAPNGQELLRVSGFNHPASVSAVPPIDGLNAPVIVISANTTNAATSETITFDASGSYSSGHTITRYQWDFDSDGTIDFESTTPSASHSYPDPGAYSATLTVTNEIFLSSSGQSKLIRVGTLTPIVSATPTTGIAPLSVQFSFDAIDPVDGKVDKFLMDFDGNGIFELEQPKPGTVNHTYNTPGTYTAIIKILDSGNISTTAQLTITVTQAPPQAFVNATPNHGPAPLQVSFNGSGTDSDGTIVFYEWDFDNDGTFDWFSHSSGAASFTYNTPGSDNATLRVTDNDGNQAIAIQTITITPSTTKLPTASFLAAPNKGNTPLPVSFDATASTTPLGTIASYNWDFGDNSTAAGKTASHTYSKAGNYLVSLTVTNDSSGSDTTSKIISVSSAGLPTAIISADKTSGIAPLAVTFNGTGSHDDPQTVAISKYEWIFGESLFFYDDAESSAVKFTADTPWAKTTADSHGGRQCWTDSPAGDYANNIDSSLTSQTFSLASLSQGTAVSLKFWHHFNTESCCDQAIVEISTDGGAVWTELTSFAGSQSIWQESIVDLSTYAGEANLKIRFRIKTDSSTIRDGWYIDDITIGDLVFTETTPPAAPSHTYTKAGSFPAYLRVTDSDGNTDTDNILIEVNGGPPTAIANALPLSGSIPLTVNFDASASTDPNGTIAKFEWSFEGNLEDGAEAGMKLWSVSSTNGWGTTGTSKHNGRFSFTDSPSGDYNRYNDSSLTSAVIDLTGSTNTTLSFWHTYTFDSSASGMVDVSTDSGTTWATIATYTSSSPEWLKTSLDLSTYDNQATVQIRFRLNNTSYLTADGWYVDDIDIRGENSFKDAGSTGAYSHTFTANGTFNPILRVTDDTGLASTNFITITALAPPTVTISTPLSSSFLYKEDIAFNGEGSDPDGNIALYEWDFDGDGSFDWSSTNGAYTIHTYSAAGTFNPSLRVTDNTGLTATASESITISETYPADFTISSSSSKGYPLKKIVFDGKAIDLDGSIVKYEWDFDGDGTYDWQSIAGGKILSYTSQLNSTTWATENLIDGGVGSSMGWASSYKAALPQEIVFELPQNSSWNIDRLLIDPSTTDISAYWVKDFEVLVSNTDIIPTSFTSIGVFTLANTAGNQAFSLPVTPARYLMLRILSNYGNANYIELGEIALFSGNTSLLSPLTAKNAHSYASLGTYTASLRATDNQNNQATSAIDIHIVPNNFIFANIQGTPEWGYTSLSTDFRADLWDDFSTDTMSSRWPDSFGGANWYIENGVLKQNYNTGSLETAAIYGVGLPFGNTAWTDYTVSADFYSTDDDTMGLIVRYQDDSSYYLFEWNRQTRTNMAYRRLLKRTAGGVTVLAEDNVPYNSFQWYNIEVNVTGANITVSIDNSQIFSANDNSFTSGKAALWCNYNGQTWLDNIRVKPNNITYAWDLDGVAGTDATTTTSNHTYTAPGSYTASLTISDGTTTDTTSTTIEVLPAGRADPTAWVADSYHKKVIVLESDGLTTRRQISGFSYPVRVFTDPSQNKVWVLDHTLDRVFRFADNVPDNYNAVSGDNFHAISSGWNNPIDIAFLGNGDAWIIDQGNDKLINIPKEFSGSLPTGVINSSPELTANNYTADIKGTTSIVPGHIGNAINLPGTTNEYISLPYQAADKLTDFTIETWFTHDFSHSGTILAGDRNGITNAFLIYLYNSTTVRVYLDNSYAYRNFTTPPMNDGQFHHIAVTRSGDQVSVFIDGIQAGAAQTFASTTMALDLGGLILGQDPTNIGGSFYTNNILTGAIDDLRIWNYAKTQTEISNAKDNALTGNETGLIGYWPFDQLNTPRVPFKTISGFSYPREVAVNPIDGTIWVSDSGGTARVYRIDATVPDGYNIGVDTGSHIEMTGFSNPVGLTINQKDGTLWVADYYNNQIVHIAADGLSELSRLNGFSYPQFIELNQNDGTLWVTNLSGKQILHLSSDGTKELGRTNSFSYINAIAVDQETGECWVSDTTKDFVQRLAPDGTILSSKTGFNNPYGLAVMSLSADEAAAKPPVITSVTADKQKGPEGTTINFSVTASDNGTIISYEWDFKGNGNFTLVTGNSASFTYNKFGSYIPRIRVTDNDFLTTSQALVPITIGSLSAIMSTDPAAGNAPLTVTLKGRCFDPEGLTCTTAWDLGDGTKRTNVTSFIYRYNQPGLYKAILTVTNSAGTSSSTSQMINVIAQPPLVSATVTPASGPAPLAVTMQGTGTDPDGSVVRYQWDYNGDGIYDYNSLSSGEAFFIYKTPGAHTAVLKVTDNDGLSSKITKIIRVSSPPIVALKTSATSGNTPLTVSFDSNGTIDNDPGDFITSYVWNFGDNTAVTGTQTSHTFTTAGTYLVTLTVTDSTGLSASKDVTINVVTTGLPIAVATAAPLSGTPPLTVSFDGSASTDADGSITQYDWLFDDGYLLNTNGYPTHQLFLGPWPATDCSDITSHQTGIEDISPGIGSVYGNKTWFKAEDTDGNFSWSTIFTPNYNQYAYSHIYLYSAGQQDVIIKFGADDAARLWVNGILAYSKNNCEGVSIDKYSQQITLNQGWNKILFAVTNGGGGWGLAYRITDTAGTPLQLPYSLVKLTDISNFSSSSTTNASTSHIYKSAGSFDTSLTVTDDSGNKSSASVTIIVSVLGPPTASAAALAVQGDTPFAAQFNGTGSDLNGSISKYDWDFDGDGIYDWSSNTNGTTSHIYTDPGVYQAVLQVTDNEGNTAIDTIQMISGVLPEARPYAFPLSGNAPLEVQLTSNGIDRDGTIVNYQWDFNGNGILDSNERFADLNGDRWPDNPSQISTAFPYTFTIPGTYHPTLIVTDNDGLTNSTALTITVGQNQLPTASLAVNRQSGNAPFTVTFKGFGTDYDGTLTSYDWDFGDGFTGTGQEISHDYTQAGIYSATLTVRDNANNTGSASIHIRAKTSGAPMAMASADKVSGPSTLNVSFTGIGSDTDGIITLYEWDFDGDGTYDYSSATNGDAKYNYTLAGKYEASFRVTDNDGNQDIDYIKIDVTFGINASRGIEMFDPTVGEFAPINYSITTSASLTLRILDRQFNTVKTLFQNTPHTPGAYQANWDGSTSAGGIAESGIYYFVMDYEVNGKTATFDLTGDVSLSRRTPSKTNFDSTFNTLTDKPFSVNFTLDKPSEATVYVTEWVGGAGDRVKTTWLREPKPHGGYVLTWDGTNDKGNIMPPATYLWSVIAYDLPANAIIINSKPEISDVSKTPDFFMPAANQYRSTATSNLIVSFNLSKAATVDAFIKNENNSVVRALPDQTFQSGTNQLPWDGRDETGNLVAPGIYRMGLRATDAAGNQSTREYSLFRVFY